MSVEIIPCEQGSPEWYEARLGIPTASRFATVMAKGEGKTRAEYMRKLAGEVLTREPMAAYKDDNMERGQGTEDEARNLYALVHRADLTRVGFIRNGNKGASPDSLIGADGGLEIKWANAHIQIERLLRGDLPPEHKAQVQGNIWIAEREWWDFASYSSPRLPLFVVRVKRDDGYIANMAGELDRFNDELSEMVKRIRNYGMKAAAA